MCIYFTLKITDFFPSIQLNILSYSAPHLFWLMKMISRSHRSRSIIHIYYYEWNSHLWPLQVCATGRQSSLTRLNPIGVLEYGALIVICNEERMGKWCKEAFYDVLTSGLLIWRGYHRNQNTSPKLICLYLYGPLIGIKKLDRLILFFICSIYIKFIFIIVLLSSSLWLLQYFGCCVLWCISIYIVFRTEPFI